MNILGLLALALIGVESVAGMASKVHTRKRPHGHGKVKYTHHQTYRVPQQQNTIHISKR
ncbi:hypothetical protein BCR33DRAFT_723474 [Rhizoclosmatium globosum]|uniref:Uncharacterized protein n=1 Tax=Rhizoclosmatium globosum TaxID=329046 RepID=A0A1Y2BCH1_9FUNG|nr:hypothetical protein BCR33DRAFT_723474 [Rhizoclosmatium globosum]|eukprot:ORY32454.1 hypothetical protein BCR33DRAFT_723474 [Rhizoclosmatium globosum]